jgi:hypothetical protein
MNTDGNPKYFGVSEATALILEQKEQKKLKEELYSKAFDAAHKVKCGGYLGGNQDERIEAALNIIYQELTKFKPELREILASNEHDRWGRWMSYLFSKSITRHSDGAVVIPPYLAERWKRQIKTPYEKLSETEKESDRKEADITLKIIEVYK